MREFACHTNVILAQPRVPRLRADAVYVDDRRIRGQMEYRGFTITEPGARVPQKSPKSRHTIAQICEKSAKKTPTTRWDLAAQIVIFVGTVVGEYIPLLNSEG